MIISTDCIVNVQYFSQLCVTHIDEVFLLNSQVYGSFAFQAYQYKKNIHMDVNSVSPNLLIIAFLMLRIISYNKLNHNL